MDIWRAAWDAAWARVRSIQVPNFWRKHEVWGPKIVGWRWIFPIWGWGHWFDIWWWDVGAAAHWAFNTARDLVGNIARDIANSFVNSTMSRASTLDASPGASTLTWMADVANVVTFGLFNSMLNAIKNLANLVWSAAGFAWAVFRGVIDAGWAMISTGFTKPFSEYVAIFTKPVADAFRTMMTNLAAATAGTVVGLLDGFVSTLDTFARLTFGIFGGLVDLIKKVVAPVRAIFVMIQALMPAMGDIVGAIIGGFIDIGVAIVTDLGNLRPDRLLGLIQNYLANIITSVQTALSKAYIADMYAYADDNYVNVCDHTAGWEKAELSEEEKRAEEKENNSLDGILKNIGLLLEKFMPNIWNPLVNFLSAAGNLIVAAVNFMPLVLSAQLEIVKVVIKDGLGIFTDPGKFAEALWNAVTKSFDTALNASLKMLEPLLVGGKAIVTLMTQILPTSDTFFGQVVKEAIKLFGNVLALIPQLLVDSDVPVLKQLGQIGVIIGNGIAEYAGFFVDHFLMWGAEIVALLFKIPANGFIDFLQVVFGETEETQGMNFFEKLGYGLKTLWQIPGKMIAYELNALRCHIDHDIDALALAQPMRGAQGIASEVIGIFGVDSGVSNAISDALFGWYNDVLHGWFNKIFVEAGYDAVNAILKAVWGIDASTDNGYYEPSLAPGGCYCDVGAEVTPPTSPPEAPPPVVEPPIEAPVTPPVEPPVSAPQIVDPTSIRFPGESTKVLPGEDGGSVRDESTSAASRMLEQVRLLSGGQELFVDNAATSLVVDVAPAPIVVAEAPLMATADALINSMAAMDVDEGAARADSLLGVNNQGESKLYRSLIQAKS